MPQTFPPLKCVVSTKSNGVEFEKDFIKVLVDNGVGRTLSNAMFSVFRSHNVGNFPSDLRQAVGSVRKVEVEDMCQGKFTILDLRLECVELVLCLI